MGGGVFSFSKNYLSWSPDHYSVDFSDDGMIASNILASAAAAAAAVQAAAAHAGWCTGTTYTSDSLFLLS